MGARAAPIRFYLGIDPTNLQLKYTDGGTLPPYPDSINFLWSVPQNGIPFGISSATVGSGGHRVDLVAVDGNEVHRPGW